MLFKLLSILLVTNYCKDETICRKVYRRKKVKMKDKIVLWGQNEKDEKILVAIELIEKENMVKIHQFPAAAVTEEFHKTLMGDWKKGVEVPFPEEVVTLDRPLSVTDGLLPESIRVDRTDLISRAKAEWHFVVLSSKLYELYSSELSDIKEKVDNMQEYSGAVWEEMKGFWSKVQQQVYDKNLFREHANTLRKGSDEVFNSLKSMRKTLDNQFKTESKKSVEFFKEHLTEINSKIDGGKSLQPLFEELKKLQGKFKDMKFTRDDRNKVWNNIDVAFKKLKEKKYGKAGAPSASDAVSRLKNRYDGLMKAIDRMKNSIDRDLRDKNGQNNRGERAMGQLEAQLMQARVAMIDERISSKQVKMKDMLSTKAELEKRITKEEARAKKQAEKAEMEKAKKAKKEEIKQKIAEESKVEIDPAEAEKLKKAAEEIAASKKPKAKKVTPPPVVVETKATKEAIVAAPQSLTEEKVETVVEEAVAEEPKETPAAEATEAPAEETVMDKIEDVIEDVKEIIGEVVESITEKATEAVAAVNDAIGEEE